MKCLLIVLEIIDLHLSKGRQEQLYFNPFPQRIKNNLSNLKLNKSFVYQGN